MKKKAIDNFFNNMMLLKSGRELDLYKSLIDATFERICSALLKKQRGEEVWYDGTNDLSVEERNNTEIEFAGNMNVMEGQSKHWIEPFRAKIHLADEASDLVVEIQCGEFRASGNLYDIYGY